MKKLMFLSLILISFKAFSQSTITFYQFDKIDTSKNAILINKSIPEIMVYYSYFYDAPTDTIDRSVVESYCIDLNEGFKATTEKRDDSVILRIAQNDKYPERIFTFIDDRCVSYMFIYRKNKSNSWKEDYEFLSKNECVDVWVQNYVNNDVIIVKSKG